MRGASVVFTSLFAVFWTAFVLFADGAIFTNIWRQAESKRFPTTWGRVTHSEVTTRHGSKGGVTYGADIHYSYAVDGVSHEGDRLMFGQSSSSNRKWAQDNVKARPVGAEVKVWYDPHDPSRAVLLTGVQGAQYFFPFFLVPFNAVMLGFWAAGLTALQRRVTGNEAGVQIIRMGGMREAWRITAFTPFFAFLTGAGGTAFILIFVIGFSTGGNPGGKAIAAAWAAVLGMGLSSALWRAARIRSGREDLVFDEGAQTLTLPATQGRGVPVTMELRDVAGFDVEQVVTRTSKGGRSTSHYPRLTRKGGAQERLAQFYSEHRAQALVRLLEQKTGTAAGAI
jgi:hypothetical protein